MNYQPLNRLLPKIISLLFIILIFFRPLLMWTRASEVFEFPKMLFVYTMTTLICAAWRIRMIINRRILISKTPLDIPILLFLISQIISTFFSIEPHTSWFGYYGRFHGGLLSTICYTLLYYAFVNNNIGVARMGTPSSARSLRDQSSGSEDVGRGAMRRQDPTFTVIFGSAIIVSLYAILQHFGIDKNY